MRTFLILFLAAVSVAAYADRLELVNGDVITGTIESVDESTVVILTEYGRLVVDRTAVRRGEFGLTGDDLSDSLVFRFDFDGSLSDSTGRFTATNNGMRFTTDRNGDSMSALRSDGSGTYLSLAPTPELDNLDEFTVAFWVQLEDLGARQYLLSKWNKADGETADGKFTVQASNGDITVYVVDPDGTYHRISAQSQIQAMTWQAVAVTFAAGRAAIYVDGELATSTRFGFTGLFSDTSPVLVMTAQAQTDEPFVYYNALGSMDDLRLYSRALSPDEIASLAGLSGTE